MARQLPKRLKRDAMTAALILIVVLISGAALMLWLDRRAVRRH
jgi:hypothetical protein